MLEPSQPQAGKPYPSNNPSQQDPFMPQLGSSNYVQYSPMGSQQQVPPQGMQQPVQQVPANDSVYKGVHPIAAFFHIFFKIVALLTFILGGIFSSNPILIFVITILFVAADFWTTKNVSGRLLVSLRWWNEVHEDGTSKWVFESSPDVEQCVHPFDKWFFWATTVGYVAIWLLLVLFNLMSLSRLPMALFGAVLAGSNMVGFLKCSQDAKKKITQYMVSQAVGRV